LGDLFFSPSSRKGKDKQIHRNTPLQPSVSKSKVKCLRLTKGEEIKKKNPLNLRLISSEANFPVNPSPELLLVGDLQEDFISSSGLR
jgi:hypothetical protein